MTGKAVLDLALGTMFENEDEDYLKFAVPMLNIILSETFDTQNTILEAAGKEPLISVPSITGLTDELPYDEKLQRKAFPFGLAQKLCYDDGDMGKVSYFQAQYAAAVNECTCAVKRDITDLYRGDV